MAKRFSIACSPVPPAAWDGDTATVVVDVLRATTTAVTAVAGGRRCFVVPSLEAALAQAAELQGPLLAGELGGVMPVGFDLQNSPAAVERKGGARPLVLLSTSGTPLLCAAAVRGPTYAACLRNVGAQARELADRHERARLLGADSRGQFRAEDELCCAWIGRRLLEAGWSEADAPTGRVLERWGDAPAGAFDGSRSTRYLRESGQDDDLEFVLAHVDDLDGVYAMHGGELLACPAG